MVMSAGNEGYLRLKVRNDGKWIPTFAGMTKLNIDPALTLGALQPKNKPCNARG